MPLFRRTTGGEGGGSTSVAQSSFLTYASSGRVNLAATETWLTINDETNGPLGTTHTESGLAGTDPLNEWQHLGWPVREGDIVRSWELIGRPVVTTTLTDVEYILQYIPFPPEIRNGVGINTDGGFAGPPVDIVRNLWTMTDLQPPTPLILPDIESLLVKDHRDIDFVAPAPGNLKIWFRGVFSGAPAGDRFSLLNSIIVERPSTGGV